MPPETVTPDEYTTNEIIPYIGQNPSKNYQFDYTMLGPRVSALLISPWIQKGVIHSKQLQNTSILRFVQDLALPGENTYLTKRDLYAPVFDDVFNLKLPRKNCNPGQF